jgi:sugar lactone lactonase YvrE
MKKFSRFFITGLALSFFVACSSDDDNVTTPTPTQGKTGVFVANEGPFGSGSGTLSIYNPADGSVEQDAFGAVNAQPIGNIFQSIADVNDGFAFVANNSGLVRITDKNLTLTHTIDDLNSPRYALQSGDYLLISDWASNSVHFYRTSDWSQEISVLCGTGPEHILRQGDQLWVVNTGGFGVDSVLTKISLSSKSVSQSITLTDVPNSLVEDASGNIWVLCSGAKDWSNPSNDKPGALFCLNTQGDIIKRLDFTNPSQAPGKMSISADKRTLYWLENSYGGAVFKMDVNDNQLPASAYIGGSFFYSLGVHPVTNELFAGDAKDFASAGEVKHFASNGNLIRTFPVGIIPGYFHFR